MSIFRHIVGLEGPFCVLQLIFNGLSLYYLSNTCLCWAAICASNMYVTGNTMMSKNVHDLWPTNKYKITNMRVASRIVQGQLTLKKDILFIIGDWNANVGSQETPGVTGKFGLGSTEWSRAKANRVLTREHTGHSKHPFPTTQENTLHMDITRWSTLKSDWLYSLQPNMEKLYTVSKNKTRSRLWLDPEPLLPNSDWNWRKWRKPLDHSKSNPLWLYSRSERWI